MKLIMITAISAAVIFTALTTHSLLAANENTREKEELERLQSSIEQGLRNIVPSTAIMAFYSKECPTGWIIADGTKNTPDLIGEFIRGWDRGRGVDKFYELDKKTLVATPPKERPLGSWQAPTLITTAIGPDGLQQEVIEGSPKEASSDDFSSGMQADWIEDAWYSNAFKGIIYVASALAYSQNSANIKAVNESHDRPINRNSLVVFGGTRPRNVALLYCMKE
ncbi:MAG: hypothetical protein WAT29_19875 [Thiolinea sp.]